MSCIIIFLLFFSCNLYYVQCRICPSMNIINDVKSLSLLQNCTDIAGNLKIALMQKVQHESEFEGYVLPNLKTISGYLLFVDVKHLRSIGQLFPNLILIRGQTLFTDYSLIIYNMPNLAQIATTNLLSIGRGSVRIENCPNLCFVDSVNWKAIGADHLDNKDAKRTCPACPSHCRGSCWNTTHCVETPKDCHEECLGCFKTNSASHCKVCKNFDDDGECVRKCPNHKYEFLLLQKCYTKEACESLRFQDKIYWTHERECINECPAFHEIESIQLENNRMAYKCRFCGTDCKKECVAEPIESIQVLQTLKGCTHIMGPLIIKKSDVEFSELHKYLGAVRHISGTLEIVRTVRLSSLDFLRNVTYIGINDANYSIFMYENQNLQKLWKFDNVNLTLKGKIRFHDNPLLCLSEIEQLANATKVKYSKTDVSPFSNGDEASCYTVNLTTHIVATSTNATLTWEPPELSEDESYISFTVYYKEENGRNASILNSVAVCVVNEWTNIFTSKNSTTLNYLLPNSTYAYYIKLHIRSENYRKDSQSAMNYFQTLSDDPDGFYTLVVTPIDYQTVNLVWKKPTRPNGILDTYVLDYVQIEDVYLFDRDYCEHSRSPDGDFINYDEKEQQSNLYTRFYNRTAIEEPPDNCSCPEPKKVETKDVSIVTKDGKFKLCFDLAKSTNQKYMCNNIEYFPADTMEQTKYKFEKRNYEHIEIPANLTTYNVTNLKPFSLYMFYFSACNKGPMDERRCSGILERFARTKKRPGADAVENIVVDTRGDSIKVSWWEPKNPNSVIVAYRINITLNSPNAAPVNYCVRMNRSTRNVITETYSALLPGVYTVSVQAESLAGYADSSQSLTVEIESPNKHVTLIIVSVTCVLVFIATSTAYIVFKRRKMDRNYLITTINPDYEGAIYIPDHWEMDVGDIDIGRELGRGNFGIVHQGRIKSRNQPCAIKVINQTLNINQRMEFLLEASVMKSFSDCYHVVKLLGVVSLQQPILVIMELMERGDLKHYLRHIRDSSHNLTSNEIYRMAVEIADGMTYLSAKKFVHRDLAARNCMVAGDRTVKVGDFGMARDIYTTDYYRKETKGLLPVRWMAPESLADGVFTTDSDVWSYGIVLWEIATLAEQPYQGLSNEHVRQFIISRGRMTRPPECSDLLYDIMKQCWSWRPNDRPSFWDIVELLENKVSEDFKLVSFVHSREAALYSRQRIENQAALSTDPRDDLMCHYNVSDEDVSLPVGGVPRRPSYLQASLSHRRFSPPDDFY